MMNEEIDTKLSLSKRNSRVKVYVLTSHGDWSDCGAGIVELTREIISGKDFHFVQVISSPEISKLYPPKAPLSVLNKLKRENEDESTILHLPILAEHTFESQDDSIITWIDNNIQEEIAISFSDKVAMKEVWNKIVEIIGGDIAHGYYDQSADFDDLLMPTVDNLDQIRKEIQTQAHWLISITQENCPFLRKLYEVFLKLEETENVDVYLVYEIIKILLFSEDIGLLELLLSDEYYLLVFGALEYDPETPNGARVRHRDFLQNHAYYKKVIDFQDEEILAKIRLNYRINYLKDTVVDSMADDPLSNQFNQISYYASQEIFEYIMMNSHYLDQFFNKMLNNLNDSIGFLSELVQIVKILIQSNEKTEFCRKLVEKNIFSSIARSLAALDSSDHPELIDEERKVTLKLNLMDILLYITQFEMESFLDFLRISTNSNLMVDRIIHNFSLGDQGLQIQISEFIKQLIFAQNERKNEILDTFYDKFMPAFIEYYKRMDKSESYYSFVQQFFEILIHCVKSHWQRFRHFVLTHDLLHKLCQGFQSKEKSIHLSLIKFLKNIILERDDFFINHISNHNLIDDLFNIYAKNARKNNLLSSSCLEFFVIIEKQDITKLILETGEKYQDKIIELGQEKYFQSLLNKYRKIMDELNNKAAQSAKKLPGGMFVPVTSAMTETFDHYTAMERENIEDEEYFENENDEFEEEKRAEDNTSPHCIVKGSPSKEDGLNGTNYPLSEDQINLGKSCFQRIKEKLSSIKIENEEDEKFTLKNKGRKMSSSSDRPSNGISFQFSLSINEENLDKNGTTSLNTKRAGSDLTSDEELVDIMQIETQKKIKA